MFCYINKNRKDHGYYPWSFLRFWCRGPESNRYESLDSRDFKSLASASSATPACEFDKVEAAPRFELGGQDLADLRLTTWLCRHTWLTNSLIDGGGTQIRTGGKGFADLCLTTWLCRLVWSGRRGLNPRPRPWQGRALPLSYFRKWRPGSDLN